MEKKYIVRLSETEREQLNEIVRKFSGSSQKVRRAQILLKADAEGPAWTDARIAEAFGCRTNTVESIRQRLVEFGFAQTLFEKQRAEPARPKYLTGDEEARIIATRLGKPPQGYAHWSLRLLADKVVELQIAPKVSHETIRQTLKNRMNNRNIEYWVIPPECDAEFVASMEDVLETYEKTYNPAHPVICMDQGNRTSKLAFRL